MITRSFDLDSLVRAYIKACYRLEFGDGPWTLRFAAGLTRPVRPPSVLPPFWSMMTAYNPASRKFDAASNVEHNRQLELDLRSLGLTPRPALSSDAHGGHAEPGFTICGIDRADLLRLARRFGQIATLDAREAAVGLLFTATERWLVLPAILRPGLDQPKLGGAPAASPDSPTSR